MVRCGFYPNNLIVLYIKEYLRRIFHLDDLLVSIKRQCFKLINYLSFKITNYEMCVLPVLCTVKKLKPCGKPLTTPYTMHAYSKKLDPHDHALNCMQIQLSNTFFHIFGSVKYTESLKFCSTYGTRGKFSDSGLF